MTHVNQSNLKNLPAISESMDCPFTVCCSVVRSVCDNFLCQVSFTHFTKIWSGACTAATLVLKAEFAADLHSDPKILCDPGPSMFWNCKDFGKISSGPKDVYILLYRTCKHWCCFAFHSKKIHKKYFDTQLIEATRQACYQYLAKKETKYEMKF